MHSPDKGSAIARGGFQNEDDVVRKFNNWLYDVEARQWLVLMGFSLEEITTVKALKVTGHKTDVQVQVFIELKTLAVVQNLQVKLVSNLRGFNQVDKRWVATYAHLWDCLLYTSPSPRD